MVRDNSVLDWATDNLTEIGIALAAAALIVALLMGVRALVLRAAKKLGHQHEFAGVLTRVVRKTRLWFLIALAIKLVAGYLHPPPDVANTIGFLFIVAVAFQVASWARALIVGVIEHRCMAQEEDAATWASAFGIIRLLV